MNTVSVRVHYRPMRLGLCVAEGAINDLRNAIKLTSTLWGGRFNPIIPVGTRAKLANDLISMFNVDLLLPVSEGAAVENLIRETRYLPWSEMRRQPFIQGSNGHAPVFLDVFHPLMTISKERKQMAQTGWGGGHIYPNLLTRFVPDGNPLHDVLLCTLGEYPPKSEVPIDYGELADRLVGSDYPFADSLSSDYWEKLTPLVVTQRDLIVYRSRGGWSSPGIFVGDPSRFGDLVSFWNLRAAGVGVVFVAQDRYEELIPGAQAWIERVKTPYSDQQSFPLNNPSAWSERSETVDWAMVGGHFDVQLMRHDLSDTAWNGMNIKPPQIHFEEQSTLGTVDEDKGRISVAFSFPAKPFADNTDSSQHAILTVRPLLDPNPAIGTFRYPNVPQLNEFYGREAHFDYSKARIEEEGLGIVIRADDSDFHLRGITPLKLAVKLFDLAGIQATQSNAGKVALRVIQHMGGVDSCRAFKIAGVRNLLHEFTLTKHFSHAQALARIGRNFDTFRRLFIEPRPYRDDLTPQDVFLHLVSRKVFRTGLELECTNCLLQDWHSLNNLGEQVSCAYCGSRFDCGPQLRDGVWQYRVSGVFARTRDHEGAIPVTLALMQTMRVLHHGMIWLTGMDLTWPGLEKPTETDLVVIGENYEKQPQLIIGECKTNMQISAEQLDKLLAVADRFRDTGIKVFIMLAKSGRDFTEEELQLIDARQTIALNFILLTPQELEPYEPYENAEEPNLRHHAPLTLEEWGEYSRIRYLRTPTEEIFRRFMEQRIAERNAEPAAHDADEQPRSQ